MNNSNNNNSNNQDNFDKEHRQKHDTRSNALTPGGFNGNPFVGTGLWNADAVTASRRYDSENDDGGDDDDAGKDSSSCAYYYEPFVNQHL